MKDQNNPFHPSYSPRRASQMAIARRPILARAIRADIVTSPYGPVFVWGEPLIGKTTVIRQVLWSLEPDSYIVTRLTLGSLVQSDGSADAPGFRRILADQINVQLQDESDSPKLILAARSLVDAINECIKAAETTGRLLVLAVEGLESLDRHPERERLAESLEYLFAIHPRLALILSSRQAHWQTSGVEFPPQLQIHYVPPLEQEEASFFLTSPVRGTIEYGHHSIKRLLAAAGGRPYLLQIIGRNCVRLAQKNGSSVVSADEATQVLQACWLAGERLFRPILQRLPPDGQRVLAALALGTGQMRPAAPFSTVEQIAAQLGMTGGASEVEKEIAQLRVSRLISDTPTGLYYLPCGWFAMYLRAGSVGLGVVT